jgi:hypothetical protein
MVPRNIGMHKIGRYLDFTVGRPADDALNRFLEDVPSPLQVAFGDRDYDRCGHGGLLK